MLKYLAPSAYLLHKIGTVKVGKLGLKSHMCNTLYGLIAAYANNLKKLTKQSL